MLSNFLPKKSFGRQRASESISKIKRGKNPVPERDETREQMLLGSCQQRDDDWS
jgi:hypothetical protein